jgi:hypothetical protein
MLPSAVPALVATLPSSEIPQGLSNCPVLEQRGMSFFFGWRSNSALTQHYPGSFSLAVHHTPYYSSNAPIVSMFTSSLQTPQEALNQLQ